MYSEQEVVIRRSKTQETLEVCGGETVNRAPPKLTPGLRRPIFGRILAQFLTYP